MRTVGFPISKKENENRRALLPNDIKNISFPNLLYIEKGYGHVLGHDDDDYIKMGAKVVARDTVLKQDIICDPKIGDADYIDNLSNQIIFGWVHAIQNKNITDSIIRNKLTAYAWEDMHKMGRHVFFRNNEIAGEAAIVHAYMLHGVFPYESKVAVIGRGNIARGAIKILNFMGADVTVYDRKTEELFKCELSKYDVIVNAILWDTTRKDHIIYKDDLRKMKKNSLLIDISCDRNGAIETSRPTTIEHPTYTEDGVCHYVVDHTPALFYKTVTKHLSEIVSFYINFLMEELPNDTLSRSLIIDKGLVLDERINVFQNR